MAKKYTFIDSPQWDEIVNNVKGIYTSDGTMSTLLDFERVLDESDIYAFKHWNLGELVDGPVVSRYAVSCTFMWPSSLMPDPRGAKRLLPLGCKVAFRKTKIKMPIHIETPDDFKPGTHYPKLIDREVWIINITIPKQLISDMREGSIDIANQTIDLEDLDSAYERDYDTEGLKDQEQPGGGGFMPSLGGPMPSLGGPPLGGPGGLI
jgi:hypothetical protein